MKYYWFVRKIMIILLLYSFALWSDFLYHFFFRWIIKQHQLGPSREKVNPPLIKIKQQFLLPHLRLAPINPKSALLFLKLLHGSITLLSQNGKIAKSSSQCRKKSQSNQLLTSCYSKESQDGSHRVWNQGQVKSGELSRTR